MEKQSDTGRRSETKVPFGMEFFGCLAEKYADFVFRMADRETKAMARRSDWPRSIDRPVYICGLARAGSTILLNLLASHAAAASHRYRDFPFVAIPIAWNWFLDRASRTDTAAVERSHGDGMLVTPNSPEAMEEPFWMHFFPGCHDPARSNVLDATTVNPAFEAFYRAHIGKILALRSGARYVAKGNYNVTRIEYLLKLFPDARFIIPVRDPVHHVASLMKQHALFCAEEAMDRRVLNYMRRAGHFEFGLGRLPINTGCDAATREIVELWRLGEDLRGWSRYWANIYEYVAVVLCGSPALRAATRIVHYEDLCKKPFETMKNIYEHCELPVDDRILGRQAGMLAAPTYYKVTLTDSEKEIIACETAKAVAKIGEFAPPASRDMG